MASSSQESMAKELQELKQLVRNNLVEIDGRRRTGLSTTLLPETSNRTLTHIEYIDKLPFKARASGEKAPFI